jgi:hypothetical protein
MAASNCTNCCCDILLLILAIFIPPLALALKIGMFYFLVILKVFKRFFKTPNINTVQRMYWCMLLYSLNCEYYPLFLPLDSWFVFFFINYSFCFEVCFTNTNFLFCFQQLSTLVSWLSSLMKLKSLFIWIPRIIKWIQFDGHCK